MKSSRRKMLAPIIVTVILLLYYALYFGVLLTLLSGIMKYAFGIIPLVFAVVSIGVCIERIIEIRSGEEDDISKY